METKLRLRAQNAFAVTSRARRSRRSGRSTAPMPSILAIRCSDICATCRRASQHFSFNFDIAGAAFGTAALGGKYANPTL